RRRFLICAAGWQDVRPRFAGITMKMELPRRLSRLAGGAFFLLSAAAGGALADSPVETAVKDFVAGVAGSTNWTATYRDLAYDPGSDTAIVSDLVLVAKTGDMKVDIKSIALAGYAPAADGGFSAKAIKLEGGTAEFGPFRIAITDT